MNTFFISDHHFDHRNILNFSPNRGGHDVESHNEWVIKSHNDIVRPKDIVYLLGDISFSEKGMELIGELNGRKNIILGNHDKFNVSEYSRFGKVLPGMIKYKEFWLSHCPIHLAELRGKVNIHGHVHNSSIKTGTGDLDKRYVNVCVDVLNGRPLSLMEIRNV